MSAVEHVEWATFLDRHFVWRQGEHVTLIGPTGAGKTTLALQILERRAYVLALATKPRDDTMTRLVRRDGWALVRRWDRMPSVGTRRRLRIVFWPVYRRPADQPAQAAELSAALNGAFVAGSWCIFADELWWLDHLGLRRLLEAVWTQGRSLGISLVGATQRPAHVSLLAYDQATHLFLWRDNDERNLKRLASLNGVASQAIRATVATLPTHDVLYVNTRTGNMVVTRPPHK